VVVTGNAKPEAGVQRTTGDASAASVAETAKFTAVVASVASVVMFGGSDNAGAVVSATVTVNGAEPVQPFAAVASAVKMKSPSAPGVPDKVPSGMSVTPAGSPPLAIANVNGPPPPPLALSVWEYAAPNSPLANVPASVIAGHADRPDSATGRVPPFALVTTSVAFLLPRLVGWNVTSSVV